MFDRYVYRPTCEFDINKLVSIFFNFKMVRITEELVRKKSEHNEGIINSLEELSLHQEHVEKIEHLNNWCRNLEILLLQSNLISKIENLNKLKNLRYLNLAINNIERVENLERCESLEKLDLTLNFIGDIESVTSLIANAHLKSLCLTGNPCSDYSGYRNYVIAKLPHIETLDNVEISRSDRIKAAQILRHVEGKVLKGQADYYIFRNEQRERLSQPQDEVDDDTFWKTQSENAPETRVELANRQSKRNCADLPVKEIKAVRLFSKEGRPLNTNQAKLPFKFEDDPKEFKLDVAVYRYLDSNFICVDLEPTYVRVSIKGKIFQYVLPDEIKIEASKVQRSQVTGHLLITMPKLNYKESFWKNLDEVQREVDEIKSSTTHKPEKDDKSHCYLEVEPIQNCLLLLSEADKDVPPLEYF